ncbi:MAG: aminoacyl-histidine dipeptidase [Flavobacteriaceae bacterium]|nr:aminoacyl-histidine dipeptidase [Flavobacteriaceae bacterium]
MILHSIEPQAIWKHFENLNAIPRPSKKEERVRDFMKKFGENLGLETHQDAVGNIVIKKPASKGKENSPKIALQAHLDMVHQKNSQTDFDFDTQGIAMFIDGDWVRAKGTTLGADNGIGVAAIMALLESTDIPHPPLEALFTIDEETGMTGAKNLDATLISAKVMLNLDTEEDDEVDIGCAGGIDVTATANYVEQPTPTDSEAYHITVKGLRGGHSGIDIHHGFGNANKIINQIWIDLAEKFDFQLNYLQGGSLRNAIPREAEAVVVTAKSTSTDFESVFKTIVAKIQSDFSGIEPHLKIELKQIHLPEKVVGKAFQKKALQSIKQAHNGVYRFQKDFPDMVETSNNLAKVSMKSGQLTIDCLTRSSSEKSKHELANLLRNTFETSGFEVQLGNDYPGWNPEPEAEILHKYIRLYETLHGQKPHVVACHAGLECGILKEKLPDVQMISFGPTIMGAHSPDERVCISSVQKFWGILIRLLAEI